MLFVICQDSIMISLEFIARSSWEIIAPTKISKSVFKGLVLLTCFGSSLILTTNRGFAYFQKIITTMGGWGTLIIIIIETTAIIVIFGIDQLDTLLRFRTGERFPRWMKLWIKYGFLPSLCLLTAFCFRKDIIEVAT
mmetsp:Transcript_32836/g.50163  ORF Transcript_32836/g.50163 Transcript_32836/m.50163 type:complete len:137 (+) Transcript_32836:1154-1564(+)